MIHFLEQPERTGIKICGVRTAPQAEALIRLGVDALGINFWQESKRFLAPSDGQDWLPDLCYQTAVVGLFVNAGIKEVLGYFDRELFGIAQLHGDESPAYCQELAAREIPFIKAFRVGDTTDMGDLDSYATDYLLLDAVQDGYGGGGVAFDWRLARKVIGKHPDKRFLLAGGIGPENVAEAIRVARPAAVDIASGVESSPGVKDMKHVKALIASVRETDAELG